MYGLMLQMNLLSNPHQNMSPIRMIAIVNCSIRTVHNLLRLFHETNDVIEREGHGCGRTSLKNDDTQMLRRLSYRYPTETAAGTNS